MRDGFVHSTVAAKPETETGFRFLTSNTALMHCMKCIIVS